MKHFLLLLPLLLLLIAVTLAIAKPQGIGNYKIAVHRITIGVCHWDGSGSIGFTWTEEPWFYVSGIYDTGEAFGTASM